MTGPGPLVRARSPGRVVLIGDHTDYTGGLVCPMAIDRWTTVEGRRGGDRLRLVSADERVPVDVALPVADPTTVEPPWGRYAAGVAAEMDSREGLVGRVTTTVPIGAGLSSSAALEVAVAQALGCDAPPVELARLCQRAEHRATRLPSGILDQLTVTSAVEDHALLMDCHSLAVEPVPWPDHLAVTVLFVAHRELVGSPYAERVAQCAAAEAVVGPLRLVESVDALDAIEDPVVRRRARHVVTENARVRAFADAVLAGDGRSAGELMAQGHESLRADYETSTPAMDAAVASLRVARGVHGARMTGGGFGGCVVALTEPGVTIDGGWSVRPSGPATHT